MDTLYQSIQYVIRRFAKSPGFMRRGAAILSVCGILAATAPAQTSTVPAASGTGNAPGSQAAAVRFDMPKSHNPLRAYSPDQVPEPMMANSSRLDGLVRDGKLYLSLKDAIDLALENNLDLAIARYNLPIADTDILRTQAGGFFRGVNTGVVQGTPGGGVGGFGTGAPGAGAGGTTGGAGGAGAGASGLVQSTLGAGTAVASYDPSINGSIGVEHQTTPLANLQLYNVPSLQLNTSQASFSYAQAFATGTSISFQFNNSRQTGNSKDILLSPAYNSMFRFSFQQELLAGFGFGPNLRYLRIARNDKKISDIAFKDQIIATVTQIENIYWDLVGAYEQTQVNEQSSAFARQTFENAKKQFQLESIPEMEVLRAEAEVSRRDQDLTVARTSLQFQETLMKNAITKSLDDPVLEAMPVIPTDQMQEVAGEAIPRIQDLISSALHGRPELGESDVDLANRRISRQAAQNALLPSLALVGFWGSSGLAGPLNPLCIGCTSSVPDNFGGALQNAFNGSSPDYYVGLNLNIPIRNRVAKADQYRSELEYRQAQVRMEQLKKQVRIEVRNAQYALEQTGARVRAARKARDLAKRTFEITQKEQDLGAGSSYQTLSAQRDLALAELDLVNAMTVFEKAKVELDRATGATLEHNGIRLQDAVSGTISAATNTASP
ncbi:MAG TPA: TolC family protein [Candidatus Sulfotelmatobacter sp.]|nr:TolC family protein [Candidatus Sulfotelmatobacter sp.]